MQLNRISPGVVTYGSEPTQPSRGRIVRCTYQRRPTWLETAQFAEFALSATTATVLVCQATLPLGVTWTEGLLLEESRTLIPHIKTQQAEPLGTARIESPDATNSILEMRPARRSLSDKAREEMSDFEREYPW